MDRGICSETKVNHYSLLMVGLQGGCGVVNMAVLIVPGSMRTGDGYLGSYQSCKKISDVQHICMHWSWL